MQLQKIIDWMKTAIFWVSVFQSVAHAQAITSYTTTIAPSAPTSSTVVVSFASGSTAFHPDQKATSELAKAKDAALITVRGRTSAEQPSQKDEQLALARAVAARGYLIAHGVSPLKISMNYASAVDYLVENLTPEGKLKNQRVEIELVHLSSPSVAPNTVEPEKVLRNLFEVQSETASSITALTAEKHTTWKVTTADQYLSAVLARWAAAANLKLHWELNVDYTIASDREYPGEFLTAVRLMIRDLRKSGFKIGYAIEDDDLTIKHKEIHDAS